MSLQSLYQELGASLAPDGIPLHFGDLKKEYEAGLNSAILLERSHEGRVQLFGKGRFELLNRMSTNKMTDLAEDEGRGTIFTNPTARIIDRIEVYNRPEHLLLLTEPGRGAWLAEFLQKNIFFGDDAKAVDISNETKMLALHGLAADAIMASIAPETENVKAQHGIEISINDATIYAMRRKELSASHWALMMKNEVAEMVYRHILNLGSNFGLVPAGGLTYNSLRIRAGRPARPELSTDYLPLEIGLWDEISFNKGCYTGQEIIARMESRSKLAKTIVSLELETFVAAPAEISYEGRSIGMMTSSVQAPTGEIFAIGIIKTDYIAENTPVSIANVPARVGQLLGSQASYINQY